MNTQDNLSIEELTQAIELARTDANAHYNRGYAYHTKGHDDKVYCHRKLGPLPKPRL